MLIMLNVTSRKQTLLLLRTLQRYHSRSCHPKLYGVPVNRVPYRGYTLPAGIPGSGAGKGGGAGGSVRESGGGLGKYGAAQEEGYFHHKQREQIEKLKEQIKRGENINLKPPK